MSVWSNNPMKTGIVLYFLFHSTSAYKCCSDYNCTNKCEGGAVRTCSRYVNKGGSPSVKQLSGGTILGPGCFFTGKHPYVWYSVNGINGIAEGHASCNKTLCNYCPFPFEKCDYPPKKPFRELKCSCTAEGMRHTKLYDSCYKKVEVDTLCVNNQCSFERIDRILRRFPLIHQTQNFDNLGYICALEFTGKYNAIRYGCDFQIGEGEIGSNRSNELLMSSRTVDLSFGHWKVECNDADNCNNRKHFLHSIHYSSKGGDEVLFPDHKKFLRCPFETQPSTQVCDISAVSIGLICGLNLFLTIICFSIFLQQ